MLKKIYIAEDEKHIGNLEQVFLEKSGYAVTVFEEGLSLISAFEEAPAEYAVLVYLIENQDKAVSRDEMLNKVWNFSLDTVDTRATDDTMKRLRKKLLEAKSCVKIETLRGFGFRIGVEQDV